MTTATATATTATANTARNAIDWFEIPVRDVERAQAFYERLFETTLRREDLGGQTLVIFGYTEPGAGGCLIAGPGVPAPSTEGCVVYLPAGPSIDAALARATGLGAHILTPKVRLPGDMGCYAHVADSEGNRIGLHTPD